MFRCFVVYLAVSNLAVPSPGATEAEASTGTRLFGRSVWDAGLEFSVSGLRAMSVSV